MTESLPTIDFEAEGAAQAFVDSLQTFGFAAFRNHPLDTHQIARLYHDWNDFFDAERRHAFTMKRETQDGYFSTEIAESAKGFAEQDFKEYYHFYTWGRCPEDLREDIQAYYDSAHRFAAILLEWIEKYSPADVTFSEPLSNMIKDSRMTLLRVLRYPAIPAGEQRLRAAAHEDINLLTILPVADAPGLQIRAKTGEWLTVPMVRDQVLINIGDMLQEASNHYFPSTTHQVVALPEDDGKARMSLPLFLHPRPEVVLSSRYTADSYLNERLVELGVS